MSTRRQKTEQRKDKQLEDRECAAFLEQRLAEIGTDPSKWETVSFDEICEKYGLDKK